MVKFPLVLLLFEVLAGWPEGGGCYPAKDGPYSSSQGDWHQAVNGGYTNKNPPDNRRQSNDDRHHIVQPTNCTRNYMDIFNQYVAPRRYQDFPPFMVPPPYPIPQPYPSYPPQPDNFAFLPQQQPRQAPVYQPKQSEPKEGKPQQSQRSKRPPQPEERTTDVNRAQPPEPYNLNYLEQTPMEMRGPFSPPYSSPPPPPVGPLGSPLSSRPSIPPVGPGNLNPFRNEPFPTKPGFGVLPVPPMGMIPRPVYPGEMMEPVTPSHFMPKRNVPEELGDFGKHSLYKREDVPENRSAVGRDEKGTSPKPDRSSADTPRSANRNEQSTNVSSKYSDTPRRNDKDPYNTLPEGSGKGIQFVTGAPYYQPRFRGPVIPPSPTQFDPMVKIDPPYDYQYAPPTNKQLTVFHEILRKIENSQDPRYVDQYVNPGPYSTGSDTIRDSPAQNGPDRPSSGKRYESGIDNDVTKGSDSVRKSNRPERGNPVQQPVYEVPNNPQMKGSDYDRSYGTRFGKLPDPNIGTRKYIGGPNYAEPPQADPAVKYQPVRQYEPPNRNFQNPRRLETAIVEPYYVVRPVMLGRPDIPYEAYGRNDVPFQPPRKYFESPEDPSYTELNNGSARAMRRARDVTAKMKELSGENENAKEKENSVASGIFRRYLRLTPIMSTVSPGKFEMSPANFSFQVRPHPKLQFLPTLYTGRAQFGNGNYPVSQREYFTPVLRSMVTPVGSELFENKYLKQNYMRHPYYLYAPIKYIYAQPPNIPNVYRSKNMIQGNIRNRQDAFSTNPYIRRKTIAFHPMPEDNRRTVTDTAFEEPYSKLDEYQKPLRKYRAQISKDNFVNNPKNYEGNPNHYNCNYPRREINENFISEILRNLGLNVKSNKVVVRYITSPDQFKNFEDESSRHGPGIEEFPKIRLLAHPTDDGVGQERRRTHSVENYATGIDKPNVNREFISKLLARIEKNFGLKMPNPVRIRLHRVNPRDKEVLENELVNSPEEYPHYPSRTVHLVLHPIESKGVTANRENESRSKIFRMPLTNDVEPEEPKYRYLEHLLSDIRNKLGTHENPYVIRKIHIEKGPGDSLTKIIETVTDGRETNSLEEEESGNSLFVPRTPRHIVEYPFGPISESEERTRGLSDILNKFGIRTRPAVRIRICRLNSQPEQQPTDEIPHKISDKFGSENFPNDDSDVVYRNPRHNVLDFERVSERDNEIGTFRNRPIPDIFSTKSLGDAKSSSFYRSVRYESGPGDTITKVVETISPDGGHEKAVYRLPASKFHRHSDFNDESLTAAGLGKWFERSSGLSNMLSDLLKKFRRNRDPSHIRYEKDPEESFLTVTQTGSKEKSPSSDAPKEESSIASRIMGDIMRKFNIPEDHCFVKTVRLERGPGDNFTKITETTSADGREIIRKKAVYDTPARPNKEGGDSSRSRDGALGRLLNLSPFRRDEADSEDSRPEVRRYKFFITPNLEPKFLSLRPHVFLSRPESDSSNRFEPTPLPVTTTPSPLDVRDADRGKENADAVSPTNGQIAASGVSAEGLQEPPSVVKSENSTISLSNCFRILDALSSVLCPTCVIRPRTLFTAAFDRFKGETSA